MEICLIPHSQGGSMENLTRIRAFGSDHEESRCRGGVVAEGDPGLSKGCLPLLIWHLQQFQQRGVLDRAGLVARPNQLGGHHKACRDVIPSDSWRVDLHKSITQSPTARMPIQMSNTSLPRPYKWRSGHLCWRFRSAVNFGLQMSSKEACVPA